MARAPARGDGNDGNEGYDDMYDAPYQELSYDQGPYDRRRQPEPFNERAYSVAEGFVPDVDAYDEENARGGGGNGTAAVAQTPPAELQYVRRNKEWFQTTVPDPDFSGIMVYQGGIPTQIYNSEAGEVDQLLMDQVALRRQDQRRQEQRPWQEGKKKECATTNQLQLKRQQLRTKLKQCSRM